MKKETRKSNLKHKKHKIDKTDKLAVMDGDKINYLKQNLPDNFFETMFMTEMELSEEFDHQKFLNLFQLYSTAIQYYSYTDKSKVKLYQTRMEHYLTKKATLSSLTIINKEKTSMKTSPNNQLKRSQTTVSRVRGRAKTIFKYKAKDINKNEISSHVKEILKDVITLMKIDKKNLRNIINEEMIKQRQNFIEKLNEKRGLINYWKNKRKTIWVKNRNNPRKENRKTIYIKNRGRKNEISFHKTRTMINNDESYELDQNQNEKEYLKLLNEIDGGNSNSSDDDSIIKDSYEEEEEEKSNSSSGSSSSSDSSSEEEEEEEDNDKIIHNFKKLEKNNSYNNSLNNSLNKSKDYFSNNHSKFNLLNEIDESVEYEKKNFENKKSNIIQKKIEVNYIKNNIDEKIEKKENKYQSSKNLLSILTLPPIEDKDEKVKEKQIPPTEQKDKDKNENNNNEIDKIDNNGKKEIDKNDEKKENNSKKENILNSEINKENKIESTLFKRRKSIETEDVIRKIELETEFKNEINEKMEKIENISEIINAGDESNFASTRSLPVITQKVNIEQIEPEFRHIFLKIFAKMNEYVDALNKYFYTEMFDNFYIKLKELYKEKYEKYLKINDEYFCNIKENEFLIDNNDKIDSVEKTQIQNIIDCLKEEQKDQTNEILDEYNRNISNLINDYKQNALQKNVGVQLLEEQLKLDVYTLINEAFY